MAACRNEVSVRIGTVFERSKLAIRTVLLLLYFWSMRRTAENAVTELEVSSRTVADWYKFCRLKGYILHVKMFPAYIYGMYIAR